jgi:hypothetical protein
MKRINPKKSKGIKAKKDKQYKTQEERTQIVEETIKKLQEVHLIGTDDEGQLYSGFDGIQELLIILNEYKKPKLLSGFSGVIKVPELQRNIEYILPIRKDSEHGIRLVAIE